MVVFICAPQVVNEAVRVLEVAELSASPLADLAPEVPRPHVREQLVGRVEVLPAEVAAGVAGLVLCNLCRAVQRQLQREVAPGLRVESDPILQMHSMTKAMERCLHDNLNDPKKEEGQQFHELLSPYVAGMPQPVCHS